MEFHRPVVMGAHGMAATGHPLASNAALDVLKSGGNAVDAALCASAALSVVKSYHCASAGMFSESFTRLKNGGFVFSMAADDHPSCSAANCTPTGFRIAAFSPPRRLVPSMLGLRPLQN